MSLGGFVAGPDQAMDWMTGISFRPGLVEEYSETTGAVLEAGNGSTPTPSAGSTAAPGEDRCSSSRTIPKTRRLSMA